MEEESSVEEYGKKKKVGVLIIILAIALVVIGYKMNIINNFDLIEVGVMMATMIIIGSWIIIKKKLGIKEKEKTELQLLMKEKEILIEEHEKSVEEIDKKIEKHNSLDITKWLWWFINLGTIVFFASMIYFGSLDGTYLERETYESSLNSSMEIGNIAIGNAATAITSSFQYLIMAFYDLGSERPTAMFWMFWILAFYWIGYVYIYRILLEGSYRTIKEIFIPFLKDVKEVLINLKRGNNGSE